MCIVGVSIRLHLRKRLSFSAREREAIFFLVYMGAAGSIYPLHTTTLCWLPATTIGAILRSLALEWKYVFQRGSLHICVHMSSLEGTRIGCPVFFSD